MKELVKWSLTEYGDLPWRKRRSLYHTLVSEIMLQQTTVSTVLNHFDRFLNVYPDIFSLAKASEEEVCSHWQGLGYYRRARSLRKAALYLVENHQGNFPLDEDSLKEIPGIGDYTAAALVAIGGDKRALAVDANIERVIARLFHIEETKGLKLQKLIRKKFSDNEFSLIEKGASPRNLNEALMDLGRVYCQARRADCHICPLGKMCKTKKSKTNPLEIPKVVEKEKKNKNIELELLRVVVFSKGKLLARGRDEGQWLSGQIEIPTFILSSGDKKLSQYPWAKIPKTMLKDLPLIKTAITKYKITNRIMPLTNKEFQVLTRTYDLAGDYKFYNFDGQKHHFSTTTHKVMEKLKG